MSPDTEMHWSIAGKRSTAIDDRVNLDRTGERAASEVVAIRCQMDQPQQRLDVHP